MQALNPQTPSLLGLCNRSTHTCDKKLKLSCLWLQDHPWKLRSSAPLMTREGSNFYNTGSWDISRNNTGRKYERTFWVQNPRYKEGTLFSLWKALLKMCLGFSLYTRRSRSETLILFRLELLLGLIKILQMRLLIDRACLSINWNRQILKSSFCNLLVLESWLESPWALSNNIYRL